MNRRRQECWGRSGSWNSSRRWGRGTCASRSSRAAGRHLLPAPVDGITLEDKIALTREIAARGGNITQLNTVRRELSRVKGGGLAGVAALVT